MNPLAGLKAVIESWIRNPMAMIQEIDEQEQRQQHLASITDATQTVQMNVGPGMAMIDDEIAAWNERFGGKL